MMMKCFQAKTGEVEAKWYVVDATDKVLGRMAVRIAMILMGKHRPQYTPHVDTGEFVVVINAEKIKLTGKKMTDKVYYHHSGYMGGLKATTPQKLLEKHPERIIEYAVRGMLPKTRLGDRLFTKLKVYAGPEHPHQAQCPKALAVID